MKRILYILILLLTLTATAQPLPVQEVPSGGEGKEFTLKIPVRFKDVVAVDFVWYRDNVAVTAVTRLTDSETLPDGRTLGKISYTIPDSAAYGEAEYRFEYRVDRCDWLPGAYRYAVKFLPSCGLDSAGYVVGDEEYAAEYDCKLEDVGSVIGDDAPALELDCRLEVVGSVVGDDEPVKVITCELEGAGSIVGSEAEAPEHYCKLEGAGSIVGSE